MSAGTGRAARWILGLLGAGALLRMAGTGALAAPPLGSVDQLSAWVEARTPAAAAMALVRLVAEVSVWYVLGLSVLHATAGALHLSGGHRLVDTLAVPGVRRIVKTGLGLGLSAASVGGPNAAVAPPETATMTPVVEAPTVAQRHVEDPGGTATMRPGVVVAPAADRPGGIAQMVPVQPVPVQPVPVPTTWTVAPGDSFWSIAQELLADSWGRAPSDAEVDPLWRTLVERNRGRLVDPADPDLIHAGQVFEVPPLPSPAV